MSHHSRERDIISQATSSHDDISIGDLPSRPGSIREEKLSQYGIGGGSGLGIRRPAPFTSPSHIMGHKQESRLSFRRGRGRRSHPHRFSRTEKSWEIREIYGLYSEGRHRRHDKFGLPLDSRGENFSSAPGGERGAWGALPITGGKAKMWLLMKRTPFKRYSAAACGGVAQVARARDS